MAHQRMLPHERAWTSGVSGPIGQLVPAIERVSPRYRLNESIRSRKQIRFRLVAEAFLPPDVLSTL